MNATTIRATLEAIKASITAAGSGGSRALLFLDAMAERGFDVILVPIPPVAPRQSDILAPPE